MNVVLIKGIYNGKAAKVKVEDFSEENIDFMLDINSIVLKTLLLMNQH